MGELSDKVRNFIGISLVASTVYLSGCAVYPNFREVYEDELYRSGQMIESTFKRKVKKHDIKSVLNLRSKKDAEREKKWCEDLEIDFYNVPMSHHVKREPLLEAIDILKEAEKPLLIHCKHGVQRAGLVSAIYVLDFKEDDALDQLSMKYFYCRTLDKRMTTILYEYFDAKDTQSFENWLKGI
jgi:protein tyrosine phosphatase (PTP) superfamily phosphohydrolase (DUF442 family)